MGMQGVAIADVARVSVVVQVRQQSENRPDGSKRPHPTVCQHHTALPAYTSSSTPFTMMLSRTSPQLAALARRAIATRSLTTVAEAVRTAEDALKYSGYSSIDFTIDQNAKVYDAVQKFAAFNIGCLVTTDQEGKLMLYALPAQMCDAIHL
jgi:hypothetical protein